MKQMLAALLALVLGASTALAAGGQNQKQHHGDKGQGKVVRTQVQVQPQK